MKKFTKIRSYRFSEVQDDTLRKMKTYGVDVGKFVRDAVSEKIKREYNDLLQKPKVEYCPFSSNTIILKK